MDKQHSGFIYELCRLCLDNAGVFNVLESSDLLEDIYTCTSVYISPSDNLPHKICDKCSGVVRDAKELRVLAAKNDAHLNSLLSNDSEDDVMKAIIASKNTENEPQPVPENVTAKLSFERGEKDINILIKTEVNSNSTDNDYKAGSTILQKISLRKDLFYSAPSPTTSPIKNESQSEDDPHDLLEAQVKKESQCKKHKKEDEDKNLKREDEDVEYVCGMCTKVFENQKKLYLHQRFHNKKYVCKAKGCEKKFATKSDLVKHDRTHTGEKPYTCMLCSKGFSQRVSLRLHTATVHTKDSDGD